MQIFSFTHLAAFLALATVSLKAVIAGDCLAVSTNDISHNKWNFVTQVQYQPSKTPSDYWAYEGGRYFTLEKPPLKGINGFFTRIFGKTVQTYHNTIHFSAKVINRAAAQELPPLFHIESRLIDTKVKSSNLQYRIVVELTRNRNKKADNPVYWLNTGDSCDLYGRDNVSYVAEDIDAIYVDVKE
jgi:hypothetical protein